MRRVLLYLNLGAGAVCLASGAACLGSWLTDPGYRTHYGDPLWLLLAYVGFYAWVLRSMWRDDAWTTRLALVKTVGAYVFLAAFPAVGPAWMARTPGRYVYELFRWGPGLEWILMGYVLLGRGLWNTANAMAFTLPWWSRLRTARPIVGRVLTMIPIALMVSFVWLYRELVRLERTTFSAEAIAVAHEILDGIDCEEIRAADTPVTRDRRRRGDRIYDVEIRWECRDLQVLVRDPEDRIGAARAPRPECCPDAGAP